MIISNLTQMNNFPAYNAMMHSGAVHIGTINGSDYNSGILVDVRQNHLYIFTDRRHEMVWINGDRIKTLEFTELVPEFIIREGSEYVFNECDWWEECRVIEIANTIKYDAAVLVDYQGEQIYLSKRDMFLDY